MHNDLYPDTVIGCLKARTVPANVNYNYTPREVAELLDYLRPRAVIYHRSFGPKFADVLPPASADLLISVDDGSDAPELPGAIRLEDALAQGDTDHDITPSPDDLMMVCTGGTTGRPKGVMWRQADTYVVSMNGADHESRRRDTGEGPPRRAALVRRFTADACGRDVDSVRRTPQRPASRALRQDKKFDPPAVLETAEREKVGMMTMVGDAYAGPLVDELRKRFLRPVLDVRDRHRGSGDEPEISTSAAGIAAADHADQRIRVVGDREMWASVAVSAVRRRDTFELREGALVVSEDYSRFLQPGEHGDRLRRASRADPAWLFR